ncbi:hypothetical protein A2335_00030 [Candidatus Peregrinibacteria bacterium RIFOXYB2_FULL_32_7]|nr:MAG: hypothetical protein A2335_00030 [Candidatus Peregrinibacteria bacterium RIFOXYB2_FULL_32_7]
MFERFSRPPKQSPVGSYKLEVISLPEECDWEKYLPLEIRYIFKKQPEYKVRIRKILGDGKAIGVRTVLRTPENILKAIHTISIHSQHNFIINWLPKLLRDKHLPIFTEKDQTEAKRHNKDLNEAKNVILKDRLRFKKIVLIDEENIGIKPEEQRFITELSEIIYPIAIDYSVFRVIIDNAQERTKIAQAIIKALLFIGPIAHFLEKFVSGLGKLFAASADDLLGESAELMALRGSGFSWRELAKRGKVLIPVFALATWGAFSVEGFIQENRLILAGIIFGLSAVALSLTTAIQSIFMYNKNANILAQEGKITFKSFKELLKLSIIQDFTNPARLGLLIGALMAPVMGIAGALLEVMHNGWILAGIGSTESIVAGITVISAGHINEWRFRRKLKKMIIK